MVLMYRGKPTIECVDVYYQNSYGAIMSDILNKAGIR